MAENSYLKKITALENYQLIKNTKVVSGFSYLLFEYFKNYGDMGSILFIVIFWRNCSQGLASFVFNETLWIVIGSRTLTGVINQTNFQAEAFGSLSIPIAMLLLGEW